MSRLRIVQILAAPYPTRQGSQVYVRGMAHALARRGHDVTVACYAHADGESSPLDGPVRVERTPRIPGYRNLRAGPDLVKPVLDLALGALLMRLAPTTDLFHAHNYEAPIAALPAGRLFGVPIVYSAHNTMREELPSYFASRGLRRLLGGFGSWLDERVPCRADAAIAISASGKRQLERLGCRHVHHSAPGVSLSDLADARPERARRRHGLGGRPWVVYAGNPDAYQDLDVLIAAMARTRALGLLMVSASSLDAWRAAADRVGIPADRRRFVVTSDWGEVRDLLSASHIAALPRAICSGFPIKLLNYLGLGLPAVVADGSAVDLPGVIRVPDRDPAAMAVAFEALFADEEWRARLSEDARREIARAWSWDVRVDELERVYAEVMEQGSPAFSD